jgi:transposase
MAITNTRSLPVAIHVASASPAEVTLVEGTIAEVFHDTLAPDLLIGDKAYDSDPLDHTLRRQGITLIAPHRRNRVKPKTQDGRVLRRYRRRWLVERFFAWLQNYRRIVTRYEFKLENYRGFALLGCMLILLRLF